MARTYTVAQRNASKAGNYNLWWKAEVMSNAGVWQDFGGLGGVDWKDKATWRDSVDQPTMEGTISFIREDGALSLAPLISGAANTINNPGGIYNPALDGGRGVRISVAYTAPGVSPLSSDYIEVFVGLLSAPDWGGRDTNSITCVMRDIGHLLMTKWAHLEKTYSTAGGIALETALQNVLDDNVEAKYKAFATGSNGINASTGAITLAFPAGGSGVVVNQFAFPVGPILPGLRDVAANMGWDVRFRYDAAGNFKLTLFNPPRSNVTPIDTFAPSEYFEIPRFALPDDDVRNYLDLYYTDKTTGQQTFLTKTNAASITKYGERYHRITLGALSPVNTAALATALAANIDSDLALPYATQDVFTSFAWFIATTDLYTFSQNAVLYDTAQNLAIIGYEHTLEGADGSTTMNCRAQVAGLYKKWIMEGSGGGAASSFAPPIPKLTFASQSITAATLTASVIDNSLGGAMLWRTRQTVGGVPGAWGAMQTSALPQSIVVTRDAFYATVVEFEVTQSDGQVNSVSLPVNSKLPGLNPGTGTIDHTIPFSDGQLQASTRDASHAAGQTAGREDEDLRRAGQGGMPLLRGRIVTDPLYEPTGATALIDTTARQFHASLQYPNGLDDMTEPGTYKRTTLNEKTGGGRGFTALDAGSILIAGSADFSRGYANSNLRYVLDDATSNRNAGTANQITGGGRGFSALDSGNVLVAASADLSRGYTNSNLRYVLDDATSNRNAGTANQITGGGRGFTAIDSGNIVVAASIDFIRTYTGKHLGNIPDDGTSNRLAVTLNQQTGAGRGFTAIDSGGVLIAAAIDMARSYTGKHLGNIPDDGTSDRRAVNLNQQTGAGRGFLALDGTNKLVSGVTAAATAADGVAGIESTKGAGTKAARQGGHALSRVSEDSRRSNLGGVPVRGAAFGTLPIYDPTGAQLILDPSNTGALSALRTLTSIKDRVQMKMSGAQVIGSGSLTKLAMDVAFFDIGAGMADTTNRRIVIPADHVGLFVFHLNLGWTASATGYRRARIQDTGVAYVADNSTGNAGAVQGTNVECWLFVDSPAAGTAFEAYGDQGSGSSLNAVAIFECFRLW